MKRVIPWILTFAALAAYPREHSYRAGTLDEIAIQDMTTTISIPVMTGPGGSLPYLLHMGTNYQFQIRADDILYVANCWSKNKKNYGSAWVVKDPVEFRIAKDKFFLKRPDKKELRLALVTRLRIVQGKSEGNTEQSVQPLSPFVTRQSIPECH